MVKGKEFETKKGIGSGSGGGGCEGNKMWREEVRKIRSESIDGKKTKNIKYTKMSGSIIFLNTEIDLDFCFILIYSVFCFIKA